jgi:hypothetical protein
MATIDPKIISITRVHAHHPQAPNAWYVKITRRQADRIVFGGGHPDVVLVYSFNHRHMKVIIPAAVDELDAMLRFRALWTELDQQGRLRP